MGWCSLEYDSAERFSLEVDPAGLTAVRDWFGSRTDPVTGRVHDHAAGVPRERGACMTAPALAVRLRLGDDPADPLLAKVDLVLAKLQASGARGEAIDQHECFFGTLAHVQLDDARRLRRQHARCAAATKRERRQWNESENVFVMVTMPFGAAGCRASPCACRV